MQTGIHELLAKIDTRQDALIEAELSTQASHLKR
jgi:hypothetical protein